MLESSCGGHRHVPYFLRETRAQDPPVVRLTPGIEKADPANTSIHRPKSKLTSSFRKLPKGILPVASGHSNGFVGKRRVSAALSRSHRRHGFVRRPFRQSGQRGECSCPEARPDQGSPDPLRARCPVSRVGSVGEHCSTGALAPSGLHRRPRRWRRDGPDWRRNRRRHIARCHE